MKLTIKHTIPAIASILFITASTACKKSFLEVTPKGRLITQKTADYDLSLNNLTLLNLSTDAQVLLGDEVGALQTYFEAFSVRNQRLFRYADVVYEPNEDAPETKVPMQNIYVYNKIINEVMDATDGSEAEKKRLQAEAMVGRAWTYFLLINYYGKPYNASTAAEDPGFPIVTTADITVSNYTRASVKAVYDFIVQDLTAAMPQLTAQTTHRLRVSRAAAEGLLAKVYMFMGRFEDALPLLNGAIADIANAAIPVRLYDYNKTFAPGGLFLPIGTYGPNYPSVPNNEENVYAKQFLNYWTFTDNQILITAATVALYGASDLRRKFYTNTPFPSGDPFTSPMLRRTGPNTTQFGIIVPELYLLRAECKARLNDLPGAKADVETLREKRMPPADAPVPAATASQQLPLLQFILDERIREFAVQGSRWFDMRRLSVDPLFPNLSFSHSLYSATGTGIATYTVKPERLTLRVPEKLMLQNPGMSNNP